MTTIRLDAHTLQHDTGAITNKMVQATLQTLFLNGSTPANYNPPIFLPESQLIIPSDIEVAPPDVTDYLRNLVREAQHVAESHCYGSFVAGQVSESDEFADVGLWLGEGNYQRNNEKEILNKLGLVPWAEEAEIEQMEGPCGQKGLETGTIGDLLENLEDCHQFFARRQNSYLACFFIGRLKKQGGWCGIVSIGVAS